MKTDLSVIILSYNTRTLLRKCLESIWASRLGKYHIEVIIIDNASTDGSVEMIKELKNSSVKEFGRPSIRNSQSVNFLIKLIINQRNLGFAAGNNLGLVQAQGRYVLLLNSDTALKPDALKRTLEFMEKNKNVGALSLKTLLPSGKIDPDCHRGFPTPWASLTYFFGLEKFLPKSRLFGQYHQFYQNLDTVHEIDAGSGAFLLTRREVVKKIGLLDEKYFFYGEDLDYYFRVKQAGWRVIFYPDPLVVHHKGASSGLRKESKSHVDRKTRLKVAKASVEAMRIFYQKFYKDKYPGWLTAIVLAGIWLKGQIRILYHQLKSSR